jgi:acetyl esterase/lipase
VVAVRERPRPGVPVARPIRPLSLLGATLASALLLVATTSAQSAALPSSSASPSAVATACPIPQDVTAVPGVPYQSDGNPYHTLDVYHPAALTGEPAVLVIHGGAWRVGESGAICAEAAYLAHNGFAAFSINYTLSSPDAPSWPKAFTDVKTAARWVVAHAADYGADGSRLGALGSSAGGHLAALLDTAGGESGIHTLTTVAWSGPMDLLLEHPGPGLQKSVEQFLGCAPDDCPAKARAASPDRHVTSDDGSLLFFNSDQEIVPLVGARAMNQALAGAGVRHQLVVFKNSTLHAGQYECVPATVLGVRAPVIDGSVRWLGRYLNNRATVPTGDFCA